MSVDLYILHLFLNNLSILSILIKYLQLVSPCQNTDFIKNIFSIKIS